MQSWQARFLHYSLLGMLPNMFEELEAKSGPMIKQQIDKLGML